MNKEEIKKVLKQFTEVKWDRFVFANNCTSVFGWIKRKDGQRDFLLIDFDEFDIVGYATSSAKYSKIFAKRLDFKHINCKKIEEL